LNARRTNTLLFTAAIALFVAAGASLIAGLWLPLEAASVSQGVQPRADAQPSTRSSDRLPPLTAYEAIATRQWRSPESSPTIAAGTSTPAAPAAADGSLPAMSLEGTVGNSLAIIKLGDGSTILKAVGDEIAGARIVAISPSQVQLLRDGRPLMISKPMPTSSLIAP